LAGHGGLVVEPRGFGQRDEELTAVGVRSTVRHRQDARFAVPKLRVELVLEVVAGAAGPLSQRVAALNHEAVDDAMKDRSVVIRGLHLLARAWIGPFLRAFGQADEIRDGFWRLVFEQLDREVALAGREMRVQ